MKAKRIIGVKVQVGQVVEFMILFNKEPSIEDIAKALDDKMKSWQYSQGLGIGNFNTHLEKDGIYVNNIRVIYEVVKETIYSIE